MDDYILKLNNNSQKLMLAKELLESLTEFNFELHTSNFPTLLNVLDDFINYYNELISKYRDNCHHQYLGKIK